MPIITHRNDCDEQEYQNVQSMPDREWMPTNGNYGLVILVKWKMGGAGQMETVSHVLRSQGIVNQWLIIWTSQNVVSIFVKLVDFYPMVLWTRKGYNQVFVD